MDRDIQERTFKFACAIVRLHQRLDRHSSTARTLGSQLLRSGTSIGAQMQEANGAHSRADFILKCRIALKEARESHYWLRLMSECHVSENVGTLVNEADQIVAILTTIIKRARSPE